MNTATPPSLDRRTIGGIDFEAVRYSAPIPHWRLRIVPTGYVYQASCFKHDSRPHLWKDVEHIARLRGGLLWVNDSLTAHADEHQGPAHILWGIHPEHSNGEPVNLGAYSRNETCKLTRAGWIVAASTDGENAPGYLRETAERIGELVTRLDTLSCPMPPGNRVAH